MAEQSQVGRTRRNCFQRCKAGFDSIEARFDAAEARFDAAEAGFDAAEAAIDRTQEAQDFRVGHRPLLPHFTSADYDIMRRIVGPYPQSTNADTDGIAL